MQKKLVQSSLALTAAAALGLGSAFVASPALADGPQTLDVQNEKQVQKALNSVGGVNAYGVRGNELNIGVAKPALRKRECIPMNFKQSESLPG
ncbi:hypothetical protein [Brevibacterium aurantiacum]|uniref:Peptidoglycan bound protein (LPXTG motif) n=1 Tax=Brevibacterium aurantiacum TaxID=273384 RepID=A0A1D7W2V5_BREAU|nr:hypothetical protein [Brevibacterium aurantiacum]AOP53335.1 Putative peptidoglycan bound protein (LPXTG motif) [Brevibacterium aurantiacum]